VRDLLIVAVIALATHRLTLLVIDDRITRRPREWAQGWFEDRYERRTGVSSSSEWLSAGAYFLSCPWCVGIWVAAAVTAGTSLVVDVPLPVLVWLTASTVTGLLPRAEP
jgi:hypothetical protein